MTPLHVAAERGGRFNILKYLADSEADINIKDNDGVSVLLVVNSITDFTSLIPMHLGERAL